MHLQTVQSWLSKFKDYLQTKAAYESLYIWESQLIFQENWDIRADDFARMFDNSLQNAQTRRLWKRESYEPKRLLLAFIQMQPDFVRSMFKDLFNEDKEIGGRVDRFVFYCDELLKEYKSLNPRSIDNNHYHGDNYQMVSLYLAFHYPVHYTYYDQAGFEELLRRLGSRDVPKTNDFGRFCKVMRTLRKLMEREPEILPLHQKRLLPRHYQEESLLLVYDFYQFVIKG